MENSLSTAPWQDVPTDVLPDTGKEHLLRLVSYPIVLMIPALLMVIAVQAFLPPPRIGVDTLWDAPLRVLVGLVAIAPISIIGIQQTRNQLKLGLVPHLDPVSMLASAVFGSVLALVVAFSLGAALTFSLATLAWFATVVWIVVTAITAAYVGNLIRLRLIAERRARFSDSSPGRIS
jgi:hypothetical protein